MKAEKQIIIDEILERINASPFVLVADYTGMTVPEFAELRNQLSEQGAEFHVAKNSFVKRAAAEAKLPEGIGDALTGQTAFVVGEEDVCAAAKILKAFKKKTNKADVRSGTLDGALLDAAQIEVLADLPSKDALLAQFLGVLNMPAQQLVRVINEPASALARVLQAKANQG